MLRAPLLAVAAVVLAWAAAWVVVDLVRGPPEDEGAAPAPDASTEPDLAPSDGSDDETSDDDAPEGEAAEPPAPGPTLAPTAPGPSHLTGDTPTALPAWDAAPDAVVDSWAAATSAAADGADVIHLTGGVYGEHTWTEPDVFVRNVPGDHVVVEDLTVVASDVTVAGVEAQSFSVREGGDGAMLYRSLLSGNAGCNGGDAPMQVTLREVHRPERVTTPSADVLHVNHGASLTIEESFIEGNDLVAGADGHLDTVQIVNGGEDLVVRRSYLGRSSNATIIQHGDGQVTIEDSYLDWRDEVDAGGIGLEFHSLDVTVTGSVSQRLYFRDELDGAVLDGLEVHDNRLALAGDESNGGRIKFGSFSFADDRYPDNAFGVPDADLPPPVFAAPAWWAELGLEAADG